MTFCQTLSKITGKDSKAVSEAIEALGNTIARLCREGNDVAIPSFGTFSAELHPEDIRIDHSLGKRTLCPPELSMTFEPASSLKFPSK